MKNVPFYVAALPDFLVEDEGPFILIGPFDSPHDASDWVEDTAFGNHHTYTIIDMPDPLEGGNLVDIHPPYLND